MSRLPQKLSPMTPKAPAKKVAAKKKAATRKVPTGKKAAAKQHPSDLKDVKVMQAKLADAVKRARAVRAGMPGTVNILGIQSGAGEAVSLSAAVENGLPFSCIERLAEELNLTAVALGENYLGMSRPTLTRRRQKGTLTRPESDAAVRYARLLELATELMEGDEAAAIQWLNTPLPILHNHSPMEHARTEAGAREIDLLIGRLEHGVYS